MYSQMVFYMLHKYWRICRRLPQSLLRRKLRNEDGIPFRARIIF